MTSRTPEGKHTKRFIIEVKGFENKWRRSNNNGLYSFFPTREEAKLALQTGSRSENLEYRVRQK